MWMKRLIAVLLTLALLLPGLCGAMAEEFDEPGGVEESESPDASEKQELDTDEPHEEPTPTPVPLRLTRNYEELIVGNPTPMDGKFFTGCWGNATTDIDVRTLVNSYYLTTWGYDTGIFHPNPVVVDGEITMNNDENGDRAYVLHLCSDLYYSDGSQITAWDYAFSILFQCHPVIAELGGQPLVLNYLEGYEEYYNGETPYLSGVHVISDLMIEIVVKKEFLPYFFELYRIGFLPYPIKEIAPGCKVYDDGDGCYIGNENLNIKEPIFTKELLEATVMDPDEGYLSHPTVGSGPYRLLTWDGEVCTFEINEYYKGNEEGYKPTIPHLRFTLAENHDMMTKLENDEFQLLNKVTRQDVIQWGISLVASGKGFTMTNYPRIGQTFIVFSPELPVFQEKNVRKALNYCMDKDAIVRDYTAGYGLPMDGMIGLGQWMYALVNHSVDYPIEISENPTAKEQKEYDELYEQWEALSLDGLVHYDLDVEKAIKLLEQNEWVLNREGEPYDPEKDDVRCKMIDGELVAMDLTCAYPYTNYTATSLTELWLPHLAEAGIKVTLIPLDMKTLLHSYNDDSKNVATQRIDMFYLGDDYNIEFDPQLFFQKGDITGPEEDTMAWTHAWMFEYARRMCETEPSDVLGFMQKWVTFQEQFSDMLPLIPIYSNVYFDFYTSDLTNYDIVKYITWGDAIVPANFYDVIQSMIDMGILDEDGNPIVVEGEEGGEEGLDDEDDFEFEDDDEDW